MGIAMKVSIDLMKPGGDLSFAQIMTQRPPKKPSVGLESLFGGHMKGVILIGGVVTTKKLLYFV